MKYYLIAFLFVFITGFQSKAQDKINWMTWEEAIAANEKEPRKIFVDVYTNWCGWCKKMDASTFVHPVIVNYMNEHYYAVKFNAETSEEITMGGTTYKSSDPNRARAPHELAIQLLNGKLSYPTVVMLNEQFNSLGPIPGYQSAKSLEPMLKFIAEDLYKSQKWAEYMQTFKGEVN